MYIHVPPLFVYQLQSRTINNHRWYKTPTGNYYPSITTILGLKEKPALIAWREALGDQAADAETKRACDRGSAVHTMCERKLNNEQNPTEGQSIENIKLFNQLRFALSKISNIRLQEQALFSDKFHVAGRVDVIAEYDNVLSVIDFKTSNNRKTDKLVHDYYIQEAFYAIAYEEMYHEQIDQIVTLMAVERGLPMVWKKITSNYITELNDRKNQFYTSVGGI